jgi:hypothetical protein
MNCEYPPVLTPTATVKPPADDQLLDEIDLYGNGFDPLGFYHSLPVMGTDEDHWTASRGDHQNNIYDRFRRPHDYFSAGARQAHEERDIPVKYEDDVVHSPHDG